MAARTRTDEEIDAILDLACYCDRMSVMKTQWFGPNAGRRFRACPNNICGYQEWIDEELGPRTLEIIKELQESQLWKEERYRRRMVRMRERHQAEINQLKNKQQFVAIIGLYVLVNLMMNMALNTTTDDTEVEDDEYDSVDE